MAVYSLHRLWLISLVIVMVAGCGGPTPVAENAGPPPPPPAPVPEPKPAPPPPKAGPDPFETAMSEVSTIVKRYGAVYASVKDKSTADKAVEEIGRMTTRLRGLTAEIGRLPVLPGQEKHVTAFQTELTQMQSAALSNPDMQRVLGDVDLGIEFIAAHTSFVSEGLLPLGQVIVARQPNSPQLPVQPAASEGNAPTKN